MAVYEFGCFTLDVSDRSLRKKGRLLLIPDKLLEILTLLIDNHGRLVTKEELMLKIWANTAVEDSNLTVSISRIRRILGQVHRRKFILTFPGRGYSFIAPVRRVEEDKSEPAITDIVVQNVDLVRLNCACRRESTHHCGNITDSQASPDLSDGAGNVGTVIPSPDIQQAYAKYREGRFYWSNHTKESLEYAVEYFHQSLDLAPYYLSAYSALIDCYLRLATNYLLPTDERRRQPRPTNGLSSFRSGLAAKAESMFQLREKWEAASAVREQNRARQLGVQYPSVHQWQAALGFAKSVFDDSLRKAEVQPKSNLQQGSGDNDSWKDCSLDRAELLQIACLTARDQIEVGNSEGAYLVLSPWYEIGTWPKINDFTIESSADLLFTAGRLAGRLATSRRLPRGQIHAESLLSGAMSLFEQCSLKAMVGECRSELGRCYDRQGYFELARTCFETALTEFAANDTELKSQTLIRLAFSELKSGHPEVFLVTLDQCKEASLASPSTALSFHEMATTAGRLTTSGKSKKYFKFALEHYREALVLSEAIGNLRRIAILENNHGYLLLGCRKPQQAQSHLLRARELFDNLFHRCPELEETLARLYLEMGELGQAEKAILRSIAHLENCGEDATLAESLRTQGRILAKLSRYNEARLVLNRAYYLAKACDDTEGAALALLILSEDVSQHLEHTEGLEVTTIVDSKLCSSPRNSALNESEGGVV